MRRSLSLFVAVAMSVSPAFGQVRPQDCRPVLPVLDKAVAAVPQDVVTEPAPAQVAAKKRFFGLPFLLPLLAAGGGCVVLCGGGDHTSDNSVSPA